MPFSKPLLLLRSLSVQPLKLQLKHWRRLPKVLQMQQMMQPQCSKLSRQLQSTSRTSGVTDDVAASAQKASQVAEEAAGAAQELAEKAGLLSRFTAAAGRISGSTSFIVVTSLAEGTKTLPTTISESVKSNHDISEQRAKSVENLQASNLENYKQDVRRTQDDISSRLRDMTTTARDLTDLINRLGQSARLAG